MLFTFFASCVLILLASSIVWNKGMGPTIYALSFVDPCKPACSFTAHVCVSVIFFFFFTTSFCAIYFGFRSWLFKMAVSANHLCFHQ